MCRKRRLQCCSAALLSRAFCSHVLPHTSRGTRVFCALSVDFDLSPFYFDTFDCFCMLVFRRCVCVCVNRKSEIITSFKISYGGYTHTHTHTHILSVCLPLSPLHSFLLLLSRTKKIQGVFDSQSPVEEDS